MIYFGNEVNAMAIAYTSKLGLKFYLTNIEAQKVDSFTLQTFGMILASFQIKDIIKINLQEPGFFKKLFYWPILMRR